MLLLVLGDRRSGTVSEVILVVSSSALWAQAAIHRCDFTTLHMSPVERRQPTAIHITSTTYFMPQSSHSSTGFQPNLFMQISHLLPSNVLLNKKSSGFHVDGSGGLAGRVGEVVPLRGSLMPPLLTLARRPPGLMSVNR